ncbi:MAG: O-antigen ligase family protein, partial [Actinocatenispora sp.]
MVSERRAPRPSTMLPLWPLYVMFGLVPLWWLAGVFYAAWPLFGLLLLGLLAVRGSVRLPPGAACWLVFLGLVVLSAVRLSQVDQLASSALRLAFYLTALVVCVYAYTAVRERADWRRVLTPLMLFWLAMVALGWVGVLAPDLSLVTPLERILPHGLATTPFVHDLVHAYGTEFRINGAATGRPAAPFPYTNNWGSCFALLVPCVLAYLVSAPRGHRNPLWMVLLISLPLSLPPAFLTLNRGMFLSLGVAMVFVAVRALRHRQPRLLVGMAVLAVLGIALSQVIPLSTLIAQRTAVSPSTTDRMSLYEEALRRIVDAPLLGYGGPATVDTTTAPAPVGTQGQLWLVLFSHGIPALLVLLAWYLVVIRSTARSSTPAGLWLSGVPVAGLVQMPFYGLTYQNLSVLFVAVGVATAAVAGAVPGGRPV